MAGTAALTQSRNVKAFELATRNIAVTLGASRAGIRAGLSSFGVQAVTALKVEVSKPGTGRIYKRRSVRHQASAPGEPPAVDTGRLRSSFAWKIEARGTATILSIGTPAVQAAHLEFGTIHMRPRPYMRPVFQRITPGPQLQASIAQAEAAAVKAAGGVVRTALGHVRAEASTIGAGLR